MLRRMNGSGGTGRVIAALSSEQRTQAVGLVGWVQRGLLVEAAAGDCLEAGRNLSA